MCVFYFVHTLFLVHITPLFAQSLFLCLLETFFYSACTKHAGELHSQKQPVVVAAVVSIAQLVDFWGLLINNHVSLACNERMYAMQMHRQVDESSHEGFHEEYSSSNVGPMSVDGV